ncbi:Uncharacterised protein [Legionella beliardensis]|uniref:Secreted protein n=1 Tax=Legionella beliardensis TaxID=91822 RepID=A0A378I5I4_9GAMM|nr:hypothetical protein [Legionella beliardensis]STX30010.1 Uncharacterised protein [Legionella beliardensis]
MKKLIVSTLCCLLAGSFLAYSGQETPTTPPIINPINPDKDLLPSPFPVYVIPNAGVVNHPYPGAQAVLLPTDNSYTGSPGCYLACYSHQPGVYAVSPSISVMGQIRVKGSYNNNSRMCEPDGYLNKEISAEQYFKDLCNHKIASCQNASCWAGGDTGGWFGIQ